MPVHRRALLFMHHILSSKKKDFIRDEARALGVSGWCKVGHPGVLVVQGTDEQVTEYVKKIKRLRWQSCVVNASTEIEVEELAASFGDRVREVDEMKQLGRELERAGGDWTEWFRRGMGYHS